MVAQCCYLGWTFCKKRAWLTTSRTVAKLVMGCSQIKMCKCQMKRRNQKNELHSHVFHRPNYRIFYVRIPGLARFHQKKRRPQKIIISFLMTARNDFTTMMAKKSWIHHDITSATSHLLWLTKTQAPNTYTSAQYSLSSYSSNAAVSMVHSQYTSYASGCAKKKIFQCVRKEVLFEYSSEKNERKWSFHSNMPKFWV